MQTFLDIGAIAGVGILGIAAGLALILVVLLGVGLVIDCVSSVRGPRK